MVFGQAAPSMPSREEVLELVNKANEKTVAYDEAFNNAKPHLDKINPKLRRRRFDVLPDENADTGRQAALYICTRTS
jgi:hypothetical protein